MGKGEAPQTASEEDVSGGGEQGKEALPSWVERNLQDHGPAGTGGFSKRRAWDASSSLRQSTARATRDELKRLLEWVTQSGKGHTMQCWPRSPRSPTLLLTGSLLSVFMHLQLYTAQSLPLITSTVSLAPLAKHLQRPSGSEYLIPLAPQQPREDGVNNPSVHKETGFREMKAQASFLFPTS